MEENKKKPYGREEVVAALIEAAAELFAEHGVAAVSIRDISAYAGVNHGLVHRHFGSKENLRLKTQEYLAAKVREEIGTPENFVDALVRAEAAIRKQPLFWKVMARTFLDGNFEGDVQTSFPFVRQLVEFVQKGQENGHVKSDLDPRYIVASICAYGLGMCIFEKYIMDGTGLSQSSVEGVQSDIQKQFLSLILK